MLFFSKTTKNQRLETKKFQPDHNTVQVFSNAHKKAINHWFSPLHSEKKDHSFLQLRLFEELSAGNQIHSMHVVITFRYKKNRGFEIKRRKLFWMLMRTKCCHVGRHCCVGYWIRNLILKRSNHSYLEFQMRTFKRVGNSNENKHALDISLWIGRKRQEFPNEFSFSVT